MGRAGSSHTGPRRWGPTQTHEPEEYPKLYCPAAGTQCTHMGPTPQARSLFQRPLPEHRPEPLAPPTGSPPAPFPGGGAPKVTGSLCGQILHLGPQGCHSCSGCGPYSASCYHGSQPSPLLGGLPLTQRRWLPRECPPPAGPHAGCSAPRLPGSRARPGGPAPQAPRPRLALLPSPGPSSSLAGPHPLGSVW